MPEPSKATEWTVEHQHNMVRFKDFESAIAYADRAVSTRHLMKVIEPQRNNIVVVPESEQSNASGSFRDAGEHFHTRH